MSQEPGSDLGSGSAELAQGERWCAVCAAPAIWGYDVEAGTNENRIVFASPWPLCHDCYVLAERDDLPALRKRWDLAQHSGGRADRKYVTREFLARKHHARAL